MMKLEFVEKEMISDKKGNKFQEYFFFKTLKDKLQIFYIHMYAYLYFLTILEKKPKSLFFKLENRKEIMIR